MHTLERGTRFRADMSADVARDVATLNRLGVPFAVFTLSGDRLCRSTAAVDLLASRSDEWERIADCVRSVSWMAGDPPRDRRPTAISGVVYALSALGADCTIAVFHPAAPASPPDSGCWAPLTTRERQVAECIARGRTSREVAACLGISIHTARRHTESVYAKLGVRRRTDIARMSVAVRSDLSLRT